MPAPLATPSLVLASNSPRRQELMRLAGWTFQTRSAAIDETSRPGENPDATVGRLSREKAHAAARLAPAGAVVLGADTAVVDDGQLLGKPASPEQAEAMLRRLRDRSHAVLTGLTIVDTRTGHAFAEVARSNVTMRAYSDAELRAYVASGDPLDKAGAYAIQAADFRPVASVDGCRANVVGLPVCHLTPLLSRLGLPPGPSLPESCRAPHVGRCALYEVLLSSEAL